MTTRAPYRPEVEFVERKGVGHPDTLCDTLAERMARRLARAYIDHTGSVQPFNVDKALLAAGTMEIGFGSAAQLTKPRVILVGKADFSRWRPSPESLAKDAAEDLAEILPDAPADFFDVEVWLTQSSADLATVVGADGPVPVSNDTSFVAVSVPRSGLEDTVLQIENAINDPGFRERVPVGRDVKVMGARQRDTTRLTIAVPVLARRVSDQGDYDAALEEVVAEAHRIGNGILGSGLSVAVNQADRSETPYLTLSGTSAEGGDDGQVGRGNRFGGLITPYRPMSLEATAGKNPAAHVGKTYHAVAHEIATGVVAETAADEATVRMLSSIGAPVTQPQAVHVEVAGHADEEAISGIVEAALADWRTITQRLIAGDYQLY